MALQPQSRIRASIAHSRPLLVVRHHPAIRCRERCEMPADLDCMLTLWVDTLILWEGDVT